MVVKTREPAGCDSQYASDTKQDHTTPDSRVFRIRIVTFIYSEDRETGFLVPLAAKGQDVPNMISIDRDFVIDTFVDNFAKEQ